MLDKFLMFVFWIDKNKFLTGMVEEFAKKFAIRLYTLNSLDDSSYLLDDLNPDVIVIDGETFEQSSAELKAMFQDKIKDRKIITSGKLLDIKSIGHLSKPLDVAFAFATIASFIENKH